MSSIMVHPDGCTEWRIDGKLHRLDGPARMWPSGAKEWWVNGDMHRIDGPAYQGHIFVSSNNGRHEFDHHIWYVNGHNITDEVLEWMLDNSITWPFTPEQQAEFALRWA
jgi:hypothetical protein